MTRIEPMRIRHHPTALVQRRTLDRDTWGSGLAIDVRQLPACRDFVFEHYTLPPETRKGEKSSRRVNQAAVDAAASENMSVEQAIDNVQAWIKADAILRILEGRHGRGDPSFWCAVLAYLLETRGQADGEEARRAARKWDVEDAGTEIQRLSAVVGFRMRYPLNPQLTSIEVDDDIPRPSMPDVPVRSLPAPVTQRHVGS